MLRWFEDGVDLGPTYSKSSSWARPRLQAGDEDIMYDFGRLSFEQLPVLSCWTGRMFEDDGEEVRREH